MDQGLDVKVVRFDREHAGQPFKGTVLNSYKIAVSDAHPSELPTQIIERSSTGDTLSYIGCVVDFLKVGASTVASEQATPKPKRTSARSVVAKTAPTVPEPEPIVAPKRNRVAKQVEHATTVSKKIAPVGETTPVTTAPVKPAKLSSVDLDGIMSFIDSL